MEVHQERVFTHIGGGRRPDGTIAPDEDRRGGRRRRGAARRPRASSASVDVRGVATAAIRRASNGAALAGAVRDASGLEVEILTWRGGGAAGVRRRGARRLGTVPDGELGVVDVGGGSSELVVGTARTRFCGRPRSRSGRAIWRASTCTPILRAAGRARGGRATRCAATLDELEVPRPAEAVAVGGSAASLRLLAGPTLDAAAFARALGELAAAPPARLPAGSGSISSACGCCRRGC